MPVPTPRKKEEEKKFISRCISFLHHEDPKRPDKQITAMCFDAWRSKESLTRLYGEVAALRMLEIMSKLDTKESFQWALPIMDMYDTKNGHWIKGIALSVGTSRNLTRYERSELAAGARTLKGKPLLVNHDKLKEVGLVHDAEFEDEKIEYIACVMDESYWKKILNKEITHVSPLGQPRWWDRTKQDIALMLQGKRAGAVKGIGFEELSLVEAPSLAGDLNTTITVMETFFETCIMSTKFKGELKAK